ncbi:MAG: BlaI/MecI/CopY family transcriptional regulator [Pseudomonadota bacterium]
MARTKSELLTTVELEYMKTLWAMGHGSVRDVIDALGGTTKRAYTSVATVLKILEDKGYLSSEKRDRTLVYRPALPREVYEARSVQSLSKSLFDGTPSALVARLVDDESLDESEIAAIMAVIEQRMGRGDA